MRVDAIFVQEHKWARKRLLAAAHRARIGGYVLHAAARDDGASGGGTAVLVPTER